MGLGAPNNLEQEAETVVERLSVPFDSKCQDQTFITNCEFESTSPFR